MTSALQFLGALASALATRFRHLRLLLVYVLSAPSQAHTPSSTPRTKTTPARSTPSDFAYGIFNSFFFSVSEPRLHDYGITNVSDFV